MRTITLPTYPLMLRDSQREGAKLDYGLITPYGVVWFKTSDGLECGRDALLQSNQVNKEVQS